MRPTNKLVVPLLVVAILGASSAYAVDYLVTGDEAQLCQGSKSDVMTLSGPRDTSIVGEGSDKTNVTICVPADSAANVHVSWKASGYWKSSGNLRGSCAQIQDATSVSVRAVTTNFHDTATFYTCQ